jgi:hypothetical protein
LSVTTSTGERLVVPTARSKNRRAAIATRCGRLSFPFSRVDRSIRRAVRAAGADSAVCRMGDGLPDAVRPADERLGLLASVLGDEVIGQPVDVPVRGPHDAQPLAGPVGE